MEKCAIALDMGGTQLRAAVIEPNGNIISHVKYKTNSKGTAEDIIKQMSDAINEVIQGIEMSSIIGMGLAIPGLVDTAKCVATRLPNIPNLKDIPFPKILKDRFNIPVFMANDANLAALGEHRYGAGRGFHNIIYITVSTGVGGGIVVNDRLIEGTYGMAGEIGHIPLLLDGPICRCGHHGHFEAFASGTSIMRQAKGRLTDREESILWEFGEKLTTIDVVEAARKGDHLAIKVLRRASQYIGIAIVSFIHIFDPERIIIGGGVSHAGDTILCPIREIVDEKIMSAYRGHFDIILKSLGDNPGLLGAAVFVFDKMGIETM